MSLSRTDAKGGNTAAQASGDTLHRLSGNIAGDNAAVSAEVRTDAERHVRFVDDLATFNTEASTGMPT